MIIIIIIFDDHPFTPMSSKKKKNSLSWLPLLPKYVDNCVSNGPGALTKLNQEMITREKFEKLLSKSAHVTELLARW